MSTFLIQFEPDADFAKRSGLHCTPKQTLELLWVIQFVISHSYYGVDDNSVSISKQTQYFMDKSPNGEPTPSFSVEEYVQPVPSITGKVLGWIFHCINRNPKFIFELALEKIWEMEAKNKKRTKVDGPFGMCKNKEEWVTKVLSPYMNFSLSDDSILGYVDDIDLKDSANPAHILKNLSLEYALGLIEKLHGDTVHPDFLTIDSFKSPSSSEESSSESGWGEELECANMYSAPSSLPMQFPQGAYLLSRVSRNPDDLFNEVDMTRLYDESMDGLSRTEKLKMENEKKGNVKEKHPNHVVQEAKAWFKAELDVLETIEEKNAFKASDAAMDMFRYVGFHDEYNPGGLATFHWLEELRKHNPEWRPMEGPVGLMDNTLTSFGNCMAKQMYMLECVCGVSVVHRDILMLQIATMSLNDVDSEELRQHYLFYGPPESGKSFVLGLHSKLTISGIHDWVSFQTEKANTTNSNHNGKQMLNDELGVQFTGAGDGTGQSIIKEVMTRGLTTTKTCVIESETRDRTETVTTCLRKQQIIGCSNLNPSKMQDAIASRFGKVFVGVQDRPGIDPAMETYKMNSDEENAKKFDKYSMECKTRQALARRLWIMIGTGQLPRPDLSLAVRLLSVVFGYLKKKGINVPLRDRIRILMFCESLAIYYALDSVFFSECAPQETYNDVQLLQCAPYLICEQEMCIFAITLQHQLLMKPNIDLVASAVNIIVSEFDVNNARRYGSHVGTYEDVDYNYYCVTVNQTADPSNIEHAVTDKIAKVIQAQLNHSVGAEHLSPLIKELTNQKVNSPVYDDTGPTQETKVMEVARFRRTGLRYGLEISRSYVDEMMMKGGNNILLDAIKSTFNQKVGYTRIVTGLTYQFDYNGDRTKIYPYIFQCLDVEPGNRALVVEKKKVIRFALDFLLTGVQVDYPESKYETYSTDVNKLFVHQWVNKCGIERMENTEWVPNSIGLYPEHFIHAHDVEESVAYVDEEEEDTPGGNVVKRVEEYDDDDL